MSSESLSSTEAEDRQTVGLLSNMEARSDHEMKKRYTFQYSVATALGIVLVVLVLFWILYYRNGFGLDKPETEFNWHPMLMCLGLIFMFSQAMLIYRTGREYKKINLKLTHAGLHLSAFIFAVLALKAAFDSHNYAMPPKPNLYTLHSWVGLTTVILFVYQFISGFISFLYPGFSRGIRVLLVPIHTSLGSATFILALASAALGFGEKAIWGVQDYQSFPTEGVLVNFIGMILILMGAITIHLVYNAEYKRVALPEEEMSLEETTSVN